MSSDDDYANTATTSSDDDYANAATYAGDDYPGGRTCSDAELSERVSSEEAGLAARTSWRGASEILSLAKRLYPKKGERYIAKRSRDLALVSDDEYSLLEMSCSKCHLHSWLGSWLGRRIRIHRLSEDCHFCGILRKCHQHFAVDCDLISIYFNESRNNLQICFRVAHQYKEIHVQLYTRESSTLRQPFRYCKDVCDTAGSEASIDIMKKWINGCHMTHQHASPIQDCRPTRLIKLAKDEEDHAQLHSPEVPVKFAALSYRWGPGKESETTMANVSERYYELKTSGFPKTLQDAIHITRRLGLEYIWIDRLCIIQDNEEDWAKEASLMAAIYASAYVVLSATATEDCKDGFLHKRLEPLVIKYAQRDQENCEVRARRIGNHICTRESPNLNYTLFRRGWCMQERFLARRIIHFLPDEILFECQTERKCECDGTSMEYTEHSDHEGYPAFVNLLNTTSIPELDFAREWNSVLLHYSRMELTYAKDSLPALSGVAASLEHLKLGKYIAGIWEHGLVFQLGWSIYTASSRKRWKYPESLDILGPTFCWSSHVVPVSGSGFFDSSICNLEGFHVDLATNNPYGQVRHASICLRGRVVSGDHIVSLRKKPGQGYASIDSGFSFRLSDSDYDGKKAEQDELQKKICWELVVCFGLHKYNYGQEISMVNALLLQPKKIGTSEYIRIGIVWNVEKSWFDQHAVESTVTIV